MNLQANLNMNLQMALATAAANNANKMNQNPKHKGDLSKNPLLANIQNLLKAKQ